MMDSAETKTQKNLNADANPLIIPPQNEEMEVDANSNQTLSQATSAALVACLANTSDAPAIANILQSFMAATLDALTDEAYDHLIELLQTATNADRIHHLLDATSTLPPNDPAINIKDWSKDAGESLLTNTLKNQHFPPLNNSQRHQTDNNKGPPPPPQNGLPTSPIPIYAPSQTTLSYATATNDQRNTAPFARPELTKSELDRKHRTQIIRNVTDRSIRSPTDLRDAILFSFGLDRTYNTKVFESIRQDCQNRRTYYIIYTTQKWRDDIAGTGYRLGTQDIRQELSGTNCYIPDAPYWMDKSSLTDILKDYGTLTKAEWTQHDGLTTGGFKFTIMLDKQLPDTITYCDNLIHIINNDIPIICNYCRKMGHTERQCRSKQNDDLPSIQTGKVNFKKQVEDRMQQNADTIRKEEHKYENDITNLTADKRKLTEHHTDPKHSDIISITEQIAELERKHQKQQETDEDRDMKNKMTLERITNEIDDNEVKLKTIQNRMHRQQARQQTWPNGEELQNRQPHGEEQHLHEAVQKLTQHNEELTRTLQAVNEEQATLRNICTTKEATLTSHIKTTTAITQKNEEELNDFKTQLEQTLVTHAEEKALHKQRLADAKNNTKRLRKQLTEQKDTLQHQEEKLLMLENYVANKKLETSLIGTKHPRLENTDDITELHVDTGDETEPDAPKKRNENLTPPETLQHPHPTDGSPAQEDGTTAPLAEDIHARFTPYETGELEIYIKTCHLFTAEAIQNAILLKLGITHDKYNMAITQKEDKLWDYGLIFFNSDITNEAVSRWDEIEQSLLSNSSSV